MSNIYFINGNLLLQKFDIFKKMSLFKISLACFSNHAVLFLTSMSFHLVWTYNKLPLCLLNGLFLSFLKRMQGYVLIQLWPYQLFSFSIWLLIEVSLHQLHSFVRFQTFFGHLWNECQLERRDNLVSSLSNSYWYYQEGNSEEEWMHSWNIID